METDPFEQIASGVVTSAEQAACQGEMIPTLQEALVFTHEANWRVNVELKSLPEPMTHFPVVARVLKMIERLGMKEEQLVISSFNHDWLREVQMLAPNLEVQALIGYYEAKPLDWGDLKFKTYNARGTLADEDKIRAVTKKGVSVNLFTVNEEDEMQRFIKAGAAGIITDFPQRLNALLHRKEGAQD